MSDVRQGVALAQSIVIGPQTRFLSPFYLELASRSLQRYKRSRKKPVTAYLEVFILVAASLEAFINEVCLEKIERRKETGKSTRYLELVMSRNNRDRSIRDKWKLLPKRLWRGKKFDRRSRLWRDFNALIELRNLLVHYKSEYRQPGYVPEALKPLLARVLRAKKQKLRRVGFLESLLENHKHWTELVCSAEMGYWALDTGLNMISQFLEFAPAHDDIKDDYILMLSRLRLASTAPLP